MSATGADEALRRRIERGEARGYWEENLVAGRRSAARRLLGRMAPLAGRRVLHLEPGGCDLPERVAAGGATAIVLDSVPGPPVAPGPLRVCAGGSLPVAPHSVDDVVLFEHPASIDPRVRAALLPELAHLTAARLFVVLREGSRWDRLAGAARLPTGDFTELLRELHLGTGYRLVHREHDRRRNSVLVVAELHHLAPRA